MTKAERLRHIEATERAVRRFVRRAALARDEIERRIYRRVPELQRQKGGRPPFCRAVRPGGRT
jgi:hypothetical protein